MELGWGGFDRAKLDMIILIRIPFSFHVWRPDANFSNHQIWTRCNMRLDSLGERLAHLSYIFISEY